MPKVVSIHSYRGGTGKSNFTANLATTIALQGNRVGVVDTDVPSPGIHNLFSLEPEQTNKTLNNYLWGETPIEDAAYDVGEKLGVAGDGKLYLVPSSVKADDIARILKDGYDVKLMNDGFRSLVKSLKLDYLGFAEKLNRNLRGYPIAQTWSVSLFPGSRIFNQSLLKVSVKGLTSA